MGDKHLEPSDVKINRNSISVKDEFYARSGISETGAVIVNTKIQNFGLLGSQKETEKFLVAHPDMIDAQTVLQLLQWGSTINNDTHAFNNVIRQCVYIIYLYDLSRAVNIEPLHCVSHFFDQIQQPSYLERFEKEVLTYQTKLKELTYKEMLKEVVVSSSDGDEGFQGSSASSSSSEDLVSLDPLQVYASLPPQLQQCVSDEDLVALEYELSLLAPKKAKEYFSRMLRSGLLLHPSEETSTSSDTTVDSESSVEGELVDFFKDKIELGKLKALDEGDSTA